MVRFRGRRFIELACVLAPSMVACSLFVDISDLSRGSTDAAISTDSAGSDASTDASDAAKIGDAPTSDVSNPGDGGSAYAATILADGPIAYYRLNEKSGNTIASEVGSFTGTFTRGAQLGTASLVTGEADNLAATFFLEAGVDDSDLSLGDNFEFTSQQAFTVEMWATATGVDSAARHLLSKADRTSDTPIDGWNVCTSMDPGPVVWIERIANGGSVIRSTEISISVGTTFYFVGAYDGTHLLVYVNAVSGAPISASGSITSTTTAAFMGSANGGINDDHGFIGVLDEVAIYDKVLTQTQITKHFMAGKP